MTGTGWKSWALGALIAFAALSSAQADERDYNYVPRDNSPSKMIVGPKCLSMQDLVGVAQCDPSSHQEFLDVDPPLADGAAHLCGL